jgi:hypothetical protein
VLVLTTRQQTSFVRAWSIIEFTIGGVEWTAPAVLIWRIDSASIFATHYRQGSQLPLLLRHQPTRASFPPHPPILALPTPIASFKLLLYYTHNPAHHLISLSCGITEHLRGRHYCFSPHVLGTVHPDCKAADTPPGVHPLYHHRNHFQSLNNEKSFSGS